MNDNEPTRLQKEVMIDAVISAIGDSDLIRLEALLEPMEAVEIAHLLESVPDKMRVSLWKQIPDDVKGGALVFLGDVARSSLVGNLDQVDVVFAATSLESQDLAEVIGTLPDEIGDSIRESLDYHGLRQLEATLAFPEGTTGRLMDTEAVSVRADVSLDTVLRYLRRRESLPDHTVGFMVVNRAGEFLGELPLSALLTKQPEALVADVMQEEVFHVSPGMAQKELSALFRDYDLVSVAVVDEDNRLVGRVTIDEVVDIMDELADHQIMGAVGLDDEEDLFAPVLPSTQRRAMWLGINLATAFLAAWVIGLFEATLDKIVALAVLMPIVASMGGIAGSQTLTLIIRGYAQGKITASNLHWLANKELIISMLNGGVWALVVGLLSYVWFHDVRISLVLGAAMVVNLITAALAGIILPLIMRRIGIDPALAGSVVLTTVTDVVGFLCFLGLATLFLL
jgi:magnesium transporter